MKDTVFLVVTADGVARMTKRAPSLYRNEVAIRVTITVPDTSFRRLEVNAVLDVPEDRVIQPSAELVADLIPDQADV